MPRLVTYIAGYVYVHHLVQRWHCVNYSKNRDNKCFRICCHSLITLEPFISFHISFIYNLFSCFFDIIFNPY